jgi:membrane-bound serine protease (ClpP class)
MFELFGFAFNIISVVLFFVGLAFLLIEMFMPGFGVFGGLGILSLILCIVFQAGSVLEALIMIVVIGAVVALLWFLVLRSLKKGVIYKSFVLKDTADKTEGFVSTADYSGLLGKRGKSLTVLRPAGIAVLGGEKADVVTDGEFIPQGADVEVYEVIGRRILVRPVHDIKEDKSARAESSGNAMDM